MSAKQLLTGDDARQKIFSGISKLSKAVAVTMGPSGRNVLIEDMRGPKITKDGVTVAKAVDLEDPFENMGAQLVKEAATRTNDEAGDGTTTATVLAAAMIESGMRYITKGSNAIGIKRGILKAVEVVKQSLESQAKHVSKKSELCAIATISSQDKEIGNVVAEVFDTIGKDGVITVDKGDTLDIEMEFVEGMQFDQGYISSHFVTNTQRMESVFNDARILVTDKKINTLQELLPLLENISSKGVKELVIIAESIEGDALSSLVLNNLRGTFKNLCVKAPAFGDRRKEILKDIAALTGATLITDEVGLRLDLATLEHLGQARQVVALKDSCTIVGGKGKQRDIQARISEIKATMKGVKGEFELGQLKDRLGKLQGGIAVMRVGGLTELEQGERQYRVEDAISATRAAAEEGILPGGGTAYIRSIPALKAMETANADERIGIEIVKEAILSPLRYISGNAGYVGEVIVDKVMNECKGSVGFNSLTGVYEDMFKANVIDPKKVTRLALENAASVASMFLTLEVAICNIGKTEGLPFADKLPTM